MDEVLNLSDITVGEYLSTIIEDTNLKNDFTKQLSMAANNSKAPPYYAILAILGFVCQEQEWFDKKFKEVYPNEKNTRIKCTRGKMYKHISIYRQKNFEQCIFTENRSEENRDTGYYFTSDKLKNNIDKYKKVTQGMTTDTTLEDFFNQIWKWVKSEKKEEMRAFIKEAFGINMLYRFS